MPVEEILVLAMSRMRAGICTAGFATEPDAVTSFRWVRPVKEHGTLMLSDMTDESGRVTQCNDVVALNLLRPCPDVPHTEDWLANFIYQRPRLLRRLEGDRRARFFATHLDRAPEDVLVHHNRSLCLVRPDKVRARFSMDPYSGKYEARLSFRLGASQHQRASSPRGIPVTDIKWRALGRVWLGESGGELMFDQSELAGQLGATAIYLALGLSRGYEGQYWLMVVGVHVVPDYTVEIDYQNL